MYANDSGSPRVTRRSADTQPFDLVVLPILPYFHFSSVIDSRIPEESVLVPEMLKINTSLAEKTKGESKFYHSNDLNTHD